MIFVPQEEKSIVAELCLWIPKIKISEHLAEWKGTNLPLMYWPVAESISPSFGTLWAASVVTEKATKSRATATTVFISMISQIGCVELNCEKKRTLAKSMYRICVFWLSTVLYILHATDWVSKINPMQSRKMQILRFEIQFHCKSMTLMNSHHDGGRSRCTFDERRSYTYVCINISILTNLSTQSFFYRR